MVLFTAGYEGTSIDEYVRILHLNGVKTVVDVRMVPFSWKKGFSKAQLGNILESEDIAYSHFRSLGCPKFIRDRYKKDHDWAWYQRNYNAYLDANVKILSDLLDVVKKEPTCLLCFEEDPKFCHRMLIALKLKTLTQGEVRVRHLFPDKVPRVKTKIADAVLQPVLV